MQINSNLKPEEPFLDDLIKNIVLPSYNLEGASLKQIKIKNSDKHRAVFKVSFKNKNYCLKKVYYNEEELLFVYSAMEWLYRNGLNVPNLIPTRNNGRFIKTHNILFILTDWVNGDKCNFDSNDDVLKSIHNLSIMHKVSKNFIPIEGSFLREGYDNIYISTDKHFLKILQCSNIAWKKKDPFSKLFLKGFDKNMFLAKYASSLAASINFENLTKTLCHGDYVNKNILFKDNAPWIIDFDRCCYNYAAQDLSYFLRRLLKRSSTDWDVDLTKNILNTYMKESKLNTDDLKYIFAYLAFPQKYWRLSRDYYSKVNVYNKHTYIDLLKNTLEKTDSQLEFVIKLEDFFLS